MCISYLANARALKDNAFQNCFKILGMFFLPLNTMSWGGWALQHCKVHGALCKHILPYLQGLWHIHLWWLAGVCCEVWNGHEWFSDCHGLYVFLIFLFYTNATQKSNANLNKKWIDATFWLSQEGFSRLASMCYHAGMKLYRLRPKFHLCCHIVRAMLAGERAAINPCCSFKGYGTSTCFFGHRWGK